jgi:hypothetical protein
VSRAPKSICKTRHLFLVAVIFLHVTGCRQSPENLHEAALEASHKATAAAKQHDPQAAMDASRRARRLLTRLEREADQDPVAQRLVGEARLAVMEAEEIAEHAYEEDQRTERLGSLKAKTYRASRVVALRGFLSAAALGAEAMALQGTNVVWLGDQNLTENAQMLAMLVQEFSTGEFAEPPAWTNVAASLRTWSTNPPPETGLFLALSMVSVGQRDLALAEVESVVLNDLTSSNSAMLYHGVRAFVYGFHGWNRLAALEVEKLARSAEQSDYAVEGEDAVVMARAFVAGDALLKRDWKKADEQIAECVKLAPNHPIVVYLTGERLAANGEWEKAAESMEAKALSSDEQWIAEKLARRARELRDGKGSKQSLFLDPRFLFDISIHYCARKAKSTEAANKLKGLWGYATATGKRLIESEAPNNVEPRASETDKE